MRIERMTSKRYRETVEQLRRDFIKLSEPFVKLKCDVLAVAIPTIRLYPDGHFETTYSPEVMNELSRIDALWEETTEAFLKALTTAHEPHLRAIDTRFTYAVE